MVTYYNYLQLFNNVLLAHPNVASFRVDEVEPLDVHKAGVYPLAHLVTETMGLIEGRMTYTFTLLVLDRVGDIAKEGSGKNNKLFNDWRGVSNVVDVINSAQGVVTDVFGYLKRNPQVAQFEIEDEVIISPVVEQGPNILAGVSAQFTIVAQFQSNACLFDISDREAMGATDDCCDVIPVSPSPTPSSSPIVSPSITPSVTPTISITPSLTPSISTTPVVTPSITPSPTPSSAPIQFNDYILMINNLGSETNIIRVDVEDALGNVITTATHNVPVLSCNPNLSIEIPFNIGLLTLKVYRNGILSPTQTGWGNSVFQACPGITLGYSDNVTSEYYFTSAEMGSNITATSLFLFPSFYPGAFKIWV
jgi:hypothetical protein